MCNLNILIKNREIKETTSFISSATALSYAYNNDGEGFYCDNLNKVVKSLDKIDFINYIENLNKSNYILIHERFSTGGNGVENSHPFENDKFVLIHNGVFNSFKKDYSSNKSDTAFFFEDFNNLFNKYYNPLQKRDKIIKRVIKELLDKNTESWSIGIYDKKEKCLYYFKNSKTNIYAYKNHEYLYITTNESNNNFLTLLKREYREINLKDNIIYKIYINDKQSITYNPIGIIKKSVCNNISIYNYNDYNPIIKNNKEKDFNWEETDGLDDFEEYNDSFNIIDDYYYKRKKLNIIEEKSFNKCDYCGSRTKNFSSIFSGYVCDECINECYDELMDYEERENKIIKEHKELSNERFIKEDYLI
jgi:predicted glutamine amidotransferase